MTLDLTQDELNTIYETKSAGRETVQEEKKWWYITTSYDETLDRRTIKIILLTVEQYSDRDTGSETYCYSSMNGSPWTETAG